MPLYSIHFFLSVDFTKECELVKFKVIHLTIYYYYYYQMW